MTNRPSQFKSFSRFVAWRCTHLEFRLALTIFIFGPAGAIGFVVAVRDGAYMDAAVEAAIVFVAAFVLFAPLLSHQTLIVRAGRSGSHVRTIPPWTSENRGDEGERFGGN